MHEAKIDDTPHGRVPADDGWFILNLEEIGWSTIPGMGTWCVFESPNCLALPTRDAIAARADALPPDPVAARHGAAVSTPTDDADEAYAGRPPREPVRSPWPFRSPA